MAQGSRRQGGGREYSLSPRSSQEHRKYSVHQKLVRGETGMKRVKNEGDHPGSQPRSMVKAHVVTARNEPHSFVRNLGPQVMTREV